jgi:hypothetical protein
MKGNEGGASQPAQRDKSASPQGMSRMDNRSAEGKKDTSPSTARQDERKRDRSDRDAQQTNQGKAGTAGAA